MGEGGKGVNRRLSQCVIELVDYYKVKILKGEMLCQKRSDSQEDQEIGWSWGEWGMTRGQDYEEEQA